MPRQPTPPRPDGKVVINFLLPADLAVPLQAEVRRLHGTRSQVVRLAIAQYLQRTEAERA